MWKQTKPTLVLLSIALNLAFVGVWVASAIASRVESRQGRCELGDSASVWCPLHRQLQVSADQWKAIEPRLRAFRASADEISCQIRELRRGIVDQLAIPNPDLDVIQAKQGEILAGQRRMQRLVIEQLLAEKRVLTAEQQQRLFAMLRRGTGDDRDGPMLVPGRGQGRGLGPVLPPTGKD